MALHLFTFGLSHTLNAGTSHLVSSHSTRISLTLPDISFLTVLSSDRGKQKEGKLGTWPCLSTGVMVIHITRQKGRIFGSVYCRTKVLKDFLPFCSLRLRLHSYAPSSFIVSIKQRKRIGNDPYGDGQEHHASRFHFAATRDKVGNETEPIHASIVSHLGLIGIKIMHLNAEEYAYKRTAYALLFLY
ncbi:hypothetical protein V8F33_003179 [Rhypophila sp. PSN 637]